MKKRISLRTALAGSVGLVGVGMVATGLTLLNPTSAPASSTSMTLAADQVVAEQAAAEREAQVRASRANAARLAAAARQAAAAKAVANRRAYLKARAERIAAHHAAQVRAQKAARKAYLKRLAAKRAAVARRAASKSVSRSTYSVSGSPKAIARQLVAARGWSSGQYSCLVTLWNRESGWRVSAANPSSGAYGIPQALPGSKMSSAGPNWRGSAATQIKWGLGYISDRYGTPCGALAHSNSSGWY